MRVSLNQVKQFIDFELSSTDELIGRINRQLGGVENVIDLEARYAGATIVQVRSCEKHPNADKLNVCQVDDGSGELTQVVCGAPNVHAGMFAVWLKPGSVVPSSADDDEPFILGARELRGVMSNGMLASPKELGLGDSHDGILEVDENEATVGNVDLKPGLSFAAAFGLDDTVVEIENKMFTHRPDLFGQLGVAREIAGIQGERFESPDWYTTASVDTPPLAPDTLPLAVFNDGGENAPRFVVSVMKGVTVTQSPIWLQAALVAMGGKPINNVVDLTNYIMLMTAQPTHAYDYDKIRGARIGARMATDGETIRLLNGKTYELESSDIVIADAEGPIGLAGIMGGGDSEVSADTKNIVIEVANFDMYTLRRSSMRHGLFTDALTRFNKGQSPYQNQVVLKRLMTLMSEVTDAVAASETYDAGDEFDRGYDGKLHGEVGTITPAFINERLGSSLDAEAIAGLLKNVEFDAQVDESGIDYRAPFWRTDIIEGEDIVEEVGRLYGFDKLPKTLPPRSAKPAARNPRRELKQTIRQVLSRAGANELLTYSFVNEKLLTKSGQDPTHAYRISNALSPDLQYYRLSLTPSLLDKVAMNYRAGHDLFALFELGKTHYTGEMDTEEPNVPNEDEHLAFVIAGNGNDGAAYYAAKRYFEQVVQPAGYDIMPLTAFTSDDEWGAQLTAPYDKARSIVVTKDGQVWGVVGEFTQQVRTAFKLPKFAAGFEIHLDALRIPTSDYRPLSRFPGTSRDISIKVGKDTPYADAERTVRKVIDELDASFTTKLVPIGIYQPEGADRKTVTVRIELTNSERTLKDDEVNEVIRAVGIACVDDLGASIV
jgi:phenylalanyl-tRNA synthetase beta chain